MIYLLDTDHVSLDQRGHPQVQTRINARRPEEVAISVITVEEQMRGWLAVIRAAKTNDARIRAYTRLRAAAEYVGSTALLDYDRAADERYEHLRQQRIRIGTQDLRIAAIALSRGATLVTRNRRDFALIPGLTIEDWSLPGTA